VFLDGGRTRPDQDQTLRRLSDSPHKKAAAGLFLDGERRPDDYEVRQDGQTVGRILTPKVEWNKHALCRIPS